MTDGSPEPTGQVNRLTPRQEAFVRELLIDGRAGKAAIRAGYSPKTADQIAYQLLQKTSVREKVRAAMDDRTRRAGEEQDRVIAELSALLHADIAELFDDHNCLKPVHQWPEHWRTNGLVERLDIKEVWDGSGQDRKLVSRKILIKFADRTEILKEMGKRLKAF